MNEYKLLPDDKKDIHSAFDRNILVYDQEVDSILSSRLMLLLDYHGRMNSKALHDEAFDKYGLPAQTIKIYIDSDIDIEPILEYINLYKVEIVRCDLTSYILSIKGSLAPNKTRFIVSKFDNDEVMIGSF